MNSKYTLVALLFSVAVNIAVVGTLVYFWRQNDNENIEVQVLKGDAKNEKKIIWFGAPPLPPKVSKEIDSLRRDYHERLVRIRSDIDSNRQAIIAELLQESINRDSLDIIIENLSTKQIDAERLTIEHLLEIKPLLPHDEWKFFIRDLGPRRQIRTKIIELNDGDSTSILVNEEEIRILNQEEKILKFKHEQNKRRKP